MTRLRISPSYASQTLEHTILDWVLKNAKTLKKLPSSKMYSIHIAHVKPSTRNIGFKSLQLNVNQQSSLHLLTERITLIHKSKICLPNYPSPFMTQIFNSTEIIFNIRGSNINSKQIPFNIAYLKKFWNNCNVYNSEYINTKTTMFSTNQQWQTTKTRNPKTREQKQKWRTFWTNPI